MGVLHYNKNYLNAYVGVIYTKAIHLHQMIGHDIAITTLMTWNIVHTQSKTGHCKDLELGLSELNSPIRWTLCRTEPGTCLLALHTLCSFYLTRETSIRPQELLIVFPLPYPQKRSHGSFRRHFGCPQGLCDSHELPLSHS